MERLYIKRALVITLLKKKIYMLTFPHERVYN